MQTISLNGDWKVVSVRDTKEAERLSLSACREDFDAATVPGDIHTDLLRLGKIPDPFYGNNIEKCKWITERNWCYIKWFDLPDGFVDALTELKFDGIDTFAELYLNGVHVGSCGNMFYRYSFNVKNVLKPAGNILCVMLKSMTGEIAKYPHEGYSSCFHHERIFIRKPQCHFSWDWAPELFATGIYDSVTLTRCPDTAIQNINVNCKNTGHATFFFDFGSQHLTPADRHIVLTVTGKDFTKTYTIDSNIKRGLKQHIIKIDDPALWWPIGYGEQNLYSYTAELYSGDTKVSTHSGTFAFREIEIDETPIESLGALRFVVKINGIPVFLKGANWVPADVFTGNVGHEDYRQLLSIFAEGNMNCLRIWGGGLYEKDAFYELCDQMGILIFHDFMFSCAELPDQYPGFYEEVTREIEQQIIRLRNHPSIILWSGGNERPGGIQDDDCAGEDKFRYLFRGIANHLDGTRPYIMSSPFSYERPGNAKTSGDVHFSSMTAVFDKHASQYKQQLMEQEVPMMTEIASMGASPVENILKYIPKESLWPPDDIWILHVRGNPYDGLNENFVVQQMRIAGQHFGEITGLNDFAKKSALLQAEHVKADVEFHRSRAYDCSGALIWMFNDIWPCGSWALVDYYRTKKAGFYSMRRACRPLLPIIALHKDGLKAFIANDGEAVAGDLEIVQQHVSGGTVQTMHIKQLAIKAHNSVCVAQLDEFNLEKPDTVFFVTLDTGVEKIINSFVWLPFAGINYQRNCVLPVRLEGGNGQYRLTLKTTAVARSLYLRAAGASFDDNYIDLPAGCEYTVGVSCDGELTLDDIVICTFGDEWAPMAD